MILRKKTTFIQAISHKLKKRRADLSQDYPNVMHLSMLRPSPFMFIRASLSFCSMFHSTFWAFCESWYYIILSDIAPLKKKQASFTHERVFLSMT